MVDIAQKIADQIAYHRAELLRLESALQVIVEVTGKPVKADTPMITIRKATNAVIDHEATPPKKKAKTRKVFKTSLEDLENAILIDLRDHGPSISREIASRIKKVEADKHRIWSALYSLNRGKRISRDVSTKRYELVQEAALAPPQTEAA